ncbi:hypothetical protein BDY24DRAFT_396902 [Mrakia frigida]|uniref:uncharacterized protein n=1 Tax=Mrakia frigida TaxID=29902 RepID=UPI003FCC2432
MDLLRGGNGKGRATEELNDWDGERKGMEKQVSKRAQTFSNTESARPPRPTYTDQEESDFQTCLKTSRTSLEAAEKMFALVCFISLRRLLLRVEILISPSHLLLDTSSTLVETFCQSSIDIGGRSRSIKTSSGAVTRLGLRRSRRNSAPISTLLASTSTSTNNNHNPLLLLPSTTPKTKLLSTPTRTLNSNHPPSFNSASHPPPSPRPLPSASGAEQERKSLSTSELSVSLSRILRALRGSGGSKGESRVRFVSRGQRGGWGEEMGQGGRWESWRSWIGLGRSWSIREGRRELRL